MFRKKALLILMLVMTMSVMVACGGSSDSVGDPKQLLSDAFSKTMEIKSYAFDGSFKVGVEVDESQLDADALLAYQIFKDLNITYQGAYQEELKKLELTLGTELNIGDLQTTLNIPILIEDETIWAKIPTIPGIVPDEMAGKFIELNLKELAEMSGEEYVSIWDTAENETAVAFVKDLMDIFLKNVDDSLFKVSKEEGQVVTVDVSGDSFYTTLENVITESLPDLLALLEKSEYAAFLDIHEEDLAELKELEKNGLPPEFQEGLAEMKKVVTIDQAQMAFRVNKEGFVDKQDATFAIDVNDAESDLQFKLSITSTQNSTKLNQEQEFTVVPDKDNVLDMSSLMMMFMGMAMGGMDDLDFDGLEMSEEDELFYALFEQDWFNNPAVQEQLANDQVLEELFDPAVAEQLLNNEAYRQEWLAKHGITLE